VIGYALISVNAERTDGHVVAVHVADDMRRRGISTAMYRYVEGLGVRLRPSTGRTRDGKALWRAAKWRKNESTVRARDMVNASKRAACVLIRHMGRVLAVSRKHDPRAMGLPGGKVDPGEDERTAAARELFEETGLRVDPVLLRPVFVWHADDEEYTTTTFEVDWYDCVGPIRTTEQGRIRWVTWKELLAGPFGRYNAMLMQELGI
jgi:8-oxo-dGTP pyrophosphatase MutT (NUDIX family)